MDPNNQGYNGNHLVKRDGVIQNYTKHELQEYSKCMKNPAYFARNYIKIINLDKGLVPFDLYKYQEEMFDHFNDNRFSVVLACRQSGKSISSVVYILWYAIFHPEKTIAILANKGATAREMLSRITLALENLPFFLQPGCKILNKGSIEFSNNTKIIAASTSASSIRGYSINLLFLDEFAFVDNDETFYTSTYPVITSGITTKVIITSTANGIGNRFHKIWEGATQQTNSYKAFRVDWWDVPGRDDKWKEEQIANTSKLQFDQEFGNNFAGRGTTLINSNTLLGLIAKQPLTHRDNVSIYFKPEEGHSYVMNVDVAKGRGQDYSTFTIIDTTTRPFEVVATFRDNMISPLLFPDVIYKYAKAYNEAFILVESNDAGILVCKTLYYDIEYDNMYVESAVKKDAIGVNMNKKIKRIGCSNLKDIVEQKKINLNDSELIKEASTFEAKGTSFEASGGNHDDMIMNLVLFSWFAGTDIFNEFSNIDFKDMLYNEKQKAIEEDIVPVGFIGDEPESFWGDGITSDGLVWNEVQN